MRYPAEPHLAEHAHCGNCNVSDPLEVLGVRGDDDVHVLRAPHNAPGINCQTSNHDEIDICFSEASQKLVEGRFAQLPRAAPVNRISL
jgi:hypothetical protein